MIDVPIAVIIAVAAVLVVLAVQAFTDILHAWENGTTPSRSRTPTNEPRPVHRTGD